MEKYMGWRIVVVKNIEAIIFSEFLKDFLRAHFKLLIKWKLIVQVLSISTKGKQTTNIFRGLTLISIIVVNFFISPSSSEIYFPAFRDIILRISVLTREKRQLSVL